MSRQNTPEQQRRTLRGRQTDHGVIHGGSDRETERNGVNFLRLFLFPPIRAFSKVLLLLAESSREKTANFGTGGNPHVGLEGTPREIECQTRVYILAATSERRNVPQAEVTTRPEFTCRTSQDKQSRFGPGVSIETLPNNMTRVVEDSGKYYTWRSFGPKDQRTRDLWVDMGDLRHGQVRVHGLLSNAHKQAAVFVVQWGKVRLQGREKDGAFTFQARSTNQEQYHSIPLPLDKINSAEHPVKAGLSDAFMVSSSTAPAPDGKQTIYEYHRVTIDPSKIKNNSAIEFTALPTCLQHNSCDLCHSANESLGCSWCHVLQRCSDGMDRHRQEWLDYACFEENEDITCEDYYRDETSIDPSVTSEDKGVVTTLQNGCKKDGVKDVKTDSSSKKKEPNLAVIAGIIVALVLILSLIVVAVFINCYPAVASPLHHIQRRSSYWPALKFQNQKPGYSEMEVEGNEKYSIVSAGPH
ncbi:hypothetical protein WMY93_018692 [Mugilogobius chulae]|uniref:Plexin domain-containing protein 1 n=1 Tax=Mugilogobius chulae TaxID=88201 RepID=A0AAW0NKQ8_9GOBI